jgi:hypothetical protein
MVTRRRTSKSDNPVVLTVKIRANGEVASLERADGKVLTKPTGQMPKKPIDLDGAPLTAIYSYQLLQFGKGDEAHFIWHPWICIWYDCGKVPTNPPDAP